MTYWTIIIIGCGWLLYIGKSLILPLLFSCLFAIFLMPLTKFYKKRIKFLWVSILLAFLTILIPLSGILLLFSFQLVEMIENLPSIANQVEAGVAKIIVTLESLNPFKQFKASELINENIDNIAKGPIQSIGSGLLTSSELILSMSLTFLYTYFLLYYKNSFKNFIIYQFKRYKRNDIKDTLLQIKKTVQGYITGLGIVILILTVLNSIGLYFIGIKYPIFWGALGGMLAIIPYIGSILGGLLPFLYALSTTDTTWQPVAILIYYTSIQQIEGNFITPNVIGSKININPLVAILSLVFFGSFWGIGGIILSLPLISVARIILEQFDETRAISMLLSADIRENQSKFSNLLPGQNEQHFLLPEDEGYTEEVK
ncbi:AI-2E family transporter [Portibacter marinus]|uniref:AI-2E family transporter n=1 Tax=Portibacter marinus TaxID=2898660 RepID=UPI001F2EFAE7|nr:AI-2E family transporter [Portibacter marinus]